MTKRIRTLVVDDHGLMRQGMMALLTENENIDIVGSTDSGEGAVTQAFAVLDDRPAVTLSEEGSGATFVSLAPWKGGALAMYIDARSALTPIHARTLDVTEEGKLKLGPDAVLFVGDAGESRMGGALGIGPEGPAYVLFPASKDSSIADNSEMMRDGNRYTIVALPDDKGGASMRILRDEVVPDSGKARIRVINASPGVKDADVALQGQKDALFADVDYKSEAGYKDITPTTATVEIRSDNPSSKPILVKNVHFEPGRAYTIVLTGWKTKPVEVITFDDTETGGVAGLSLQ